MNISEMCCTKHKNEEMFVCTPSGRLQVYGYSLATSELKWTFNGYVRAHVLTAYGSGNLLLCDFSINEIFWLSFRGDFLDRKSMSTFKGEQSMHNPQRIMWYSKRSSLIIADRKMVKYGMYMNLASDTFELQLHMYYFSLMVKRSCSGGYRIFPLSGDAALCGTINDVRF